MVTTTTSKTVTRNGTTTNTLTAKQSTNVVVNIREGSNPPKRKPRVAHHHTLSKAVPIQVPLPFPSNDVGQRLEHLHDTLNQRLAEPQQAMFAARTPPHLQFNNLFDAPTDAQHPGFRLRPSPVRIPRMQTEIEEEPESPARSMPQEQSSPASVTSPAPATSVASPEPAASESRGVVRSLIDRFTPGRLEKSEGGPSRPPEEFKIVATTGKRGLVREIVADTEEEMIGKFSMKNGVPRAARYASDIRKAIADPSKTACDYKFTMVPK